MADHSMPLWEKARYVGGAYTSTDISNLPSKYRRRFLSRVAEVNAILAKYPINTYDDYQRIEREDLKAMIAAFQSLAAMKV